MDVKPSSNLLHMPLVIFRIILEDVGSQNPRSAIYYLQHLAALPF